MTQTKTDPRVIRTRSLIMDSFIQLSGKKDFKDITVKDLTAEAMINRATFYYHFEDIYDLLEKALSEVLLVNLDYEHFRDSRLDEEALVRIFTAVTNFQLSLSNRCHSGYEDTIARIIRNQLEVIFSKMLSGQDPEADDQSLQITAAMLSWEIYGASVEWRRNSGVDPGDFIRPALSSVLNGIRVVR
ncbi:DNA-binding transcriptional repressor FabR [Bhargavaea cecembensis DSE10]|uniref:DNA-binding transcriptional repressor FabR n=1 Tax=Bhargavaea cecembensis DSE10 TaxID=1235279 RepID=M7NX09_9BACL|nr:TetR/AcrR family transcriptional regulator [Bhargavaea cecembensis]EMR06190.1 DNA-binding transcriptional repressor FabR [Bhargavaea cecembensis DSE10]